MPSQQTLERCCKCDEPTGRAGRAEDSLYTEHGGPYCEQCWEDLRGVQAARIAELEEDGIDAGLRNHSALARNTELEAEITTLERALAAAREERDEWVKRAQDSQAAREKLLNTAEGLERKLRAALAGQGEGTDDPE